MFSAFLSSDSPKRSEFLSPSRERSERSACSASPTNSVASSCRTTSSVASTGIKTRQIRDLKLELEFRDSRIQELEEAYETLERRADFARGEVECVLATQRHEIESMSRETELLKATIAAQSTQLAEVTSTLQQYQAMQSMMAALMTRCKELEDHQRAQEEARQEAERASAAARALKEAEEEQQAAAREAEAQCRRLRAEAAASAVQAHQDPQSGVVVPHSGTTAPALAAASRPSMGPFQRFRSQTTMPSTEKKKDCSIM